LVVVWLSVWLSVGCGLALVIWAGWWVSAGWLVGGWVIEALTFVIKSSRSVVSWLFGIACRMSAG